MIWLCIIGFLSGIISGMGIGGGTILIPALSIFFHYSQHEAQNINLIYFIPTAITALITHVKNKNIEKTVLWKIVIFGFAGAFIGAFIAVGIKPDMLKRIFGVFLLIMGLSEVFKKNYGGKKSGTE